MSSDFHSMPGAPESGSRFKRVAALIAVAVIAGIFMAVLGPKRNRSNNPEQLMNANVSTYRGASGITLDSDPAGASVFLNGRLAGATPISLNGLPSGVYGIRFEKAGYKPLSRSLELGSRGAIVSETLQPLPGGLLTVNVKPDGAEVLLDNELVGHTPLKLNSVTAGPYELMIRKTNFEPYSSKVEIVSGEKLVFSDFELKDKILAMMEGLVKTEPQRLAHYIDLGHYHFVNGRIDDSVDVFAQGMEVMQTPLDYDGLGFTGNANMTAIEKDLEQRLRKEDESRFLKEIEKHRNWPRADVKIFRAKLEQAQDLIGRKSVSSWSWTEASARTNIRNRNYEKAARVFADHIAATPNSPNLADAYIALMEVHLMQRDALKIRETFDKFYPLFEKNGTALRQCGTTISSYYERLPGQSRYQVLFLAEKALRGAVEASKNTPAHSQCLFDLANVLNYEEKASEAIPLYEQSISTAAEQTVQDDRSLRLADALRRADRLDESRALFTRLSTSERNTIREGAKAGLVYVAAAERAKQKK